MEKKTLQVRRVGKIDQLVMFKKETGERFLAEEKKGGNDVVYWKNKSGEQFCFFKKAQSYGSFIKITKIGGGISFFDKASRCQIN